MERQSPRRVKNYPGYINNNNNQTARGIHFSILLQKQSKSKNRGLPYQQTHGSMEESGGPTHKHIILQTIFLLIIL